MKLIFSEHAWEDYLYWQTNNKKTLQRINALIQDIRRDPFKGIGKPEPLKHGALIGCWSRRINKMDRIVYRSGDDPVEIVQLRFHYSKS